MSERRTNEVAHNVGVERRLRSRRTHDITAQLSSVGWAFGRRLRDEPVLPSSVDMLVQDSRGPSRTAPSPKRIPSLVQRRQPVSMLLLAIFIVALLLRGYWVTHHSAVLEENGSEYARIAQNLLQHGEYVGLSEGPELMLPPLFPIILALGSFVAGSVDGAARLVPLLAGMSLVLAVFALAQLMYGLRVALCAATLTALHPLLIDLSSTAYSEAVYLPLMVAGIWCGLRGFDSGKSTHMLWSGTLFGLMYLTRPEAVFSAVVVLGGVFVADLGRPAFVKRFAVHSISLLAPIAILAAPYAAYLSVHTGSLRLDGKVVLNFTIGERRNAGMSHHEAALGLGRDLSEDGPLLSPSAFVTTTHRSLSVREITDYWIQSVRRNKATVFELLASPLYGSVLGMGLVVLGLFRRSWDQRRAVRESVLLTIALGHLFLMFGLHAVLGRYVLPLLPLWLLWISKGIDETAGWATQTARRTAFMRWPLTARSVGASVRCVAIVAVLLLALSEARWGSLSDQSPKTSVFKDVGIWLDQNRPGQKRVMTRYPQVAYYSGGTWLHMPYTEASLAVQYAHRKHPDFIVLIGEEPYAPYLNQWMKDGIPDRAAKLIYRATAASPAPVAIYEWTD